MSDKPTEIKVTRIPGDGTTCTATLILEFDLADKTAVKRFARLLRELVPEEERPQFAADFQAAVKAGYK